MPESESTAVSAAGDIATLFAGGEPTVEEKWQAKKQAFARGLDGTATRHLVHCADARELPCTPEDVHLVVTSPPYFNLIGYPTRDDGGQLGNCDDYQAFLDQLDRVWRACFSRLVPGGRMCVVVGDVCVPRRRLGRHLVIPLHADIAVRCRTIGFDYLTPILWAKIANATTEVAGSNRFLGKPYEPNGIIKNDIEYILMLRKPGRYRKPTAMQRLLSVLDANEHQQGYRSVWADIPGKVRRDGHPAPYPPAVAERLVRLFSFVGDTVLDPFWGSGATTVAALRAGRSSIGYEIEPSYVRIGEAQVRHQPECARADFKVVA